MHMAMARCIQSCHGYKSNVLCVSHPSLAARCTYVMQHVLGLPLNPWSCSVSARTSYFVVLGPRPPLDYPPHAAASAKISASHGADDKTPPLAQRPIRAGPIRGPLAKGSQGRVALSPLTASFPKACCPSLAVPQSLRTPQCTCSSPSMAQHGLWAPHQKPTLCPPLSLSAQPQLTILLPSPHDTSSLTLTHFPSHTHRTPPQSDTMAAAFPPLDQRPLKDTICLFDVDETLTKARRVRISLALLPLPRVAVHLESPPCSPALQLPATTRPEQRVLRAMKLTRTPCAGRHPRNARPPRPPP